MEVNKKVKIEEMLPSEIIAARDKTSIAYVNVSPLEWHSYHLPYGTDALIGYHILLKVAEKIGGVVFPTIYCGLDRYRKEDELEQWGIDKGSKIFGMEFPELPLSCEYCDKELMKQSLINRCRFISRIGFKLCVIYAQHGGAGQIDLCREVAEEITIPGKFKAIGENTKILDKKLRFGGGHAGIDETHLMLGTRPDLVNLNKISGGKLAVKDTGILHDVPVLGEKNNPKNCKEYSGKKIIDMLVVHFSEKFQKELDNTN